MLQDEHGDLGDGVVDVSLDLGVQLLEVVLGVGTNRDPSGEGEFLRLAVLVEATLPRRIVISGEAVYHIVRKDPERLPAEIYAIVELVTGEQRLDDHVHIVVLFNHI